MVTIPWKNVAMYLDDYVSAFTTLDYRSTYPLRAVILLRTSRGVVGSLGTRASYTKKTRMRTTPRMSGARTCAEFHGYRMPPQVSAINASVVPAMIMKFPP